MSAGNYVANQRDFPYGLLLTCGVFILLGIIAMGVGIAQGHPETVWRAFHVNWLYFGLMAQAAVCLSCALTIIGARWAGPVRFVPESFIAWVPISIVLFIIGYSFGGHYVHMNWIDGAAPWGKEFWLSSPRVFWTDLIVMIVTFVAAFAYVRTSYRLALKNSAETVTERKGLFAWLTADWRGDDKEQSEAERKMRVLAPLVCLLYVFGYSFVAFDQVMALSPAWFSNIFGWYVLWGGWLSGICATTLVCVLNKQRGVAGWDQIVTKSRLHDLGKMIFAFSIFWMYLFFSQYIVIWYGNLPEETEYLQARLGSQFMQDTWFWVSGRLDEPYVSLSLTAWLGCWVIRSGCCSDRPRRRRRRCWAPSPASCCSASGSSATRSSGLRSCPMTARPGSAACRSASPSASSACS